MEEATPLYRPGWLAGWLAVGIVCLLLGTVGIVVPLLPTEGMYGLAAICFARGNRCWEAWLLAHRHLGLPIRAWS